MERYSQRNFHNYLIPDTHWDRAFIKYPSEQRTIEVNHESKEYKIRSGVRGGISVWDSTDTDCSKMASAFGLSDLRRAGEATIAGFRTIEYMGSGKFEAKRMYVWLAPALGCTQVRTISYSHNGFGLPTSYCRLEAVWVQIGEPDSKLFQLPSNDRMGDR